MRPRRAVYWVAADHQRGRRGSNRPGAACARQGPGRGAAGAGMIMRSNLGWGMALVIVLAGLLWAVETVRQTTPILEVRVDMGSGVGAPAASAPPALTPSP